MFSIREKFEHHIQVLVLIIYRAILKICLALYIYTLKEWKKTLKKWIGNAVVKYDYIYYDVYT